jgi:Xaa-Pro aminopeptidase
MMKHYIHCNENAIYFECGYSCDNALYLSLGEEAYFITDGRYELEAKLAVKGAEVVIDKDIYGRAITLLKQSGVKKVAFDPKEFHVFGFEKLRTKTEITFVPSVDFSHTKRMVKRSDEIALLSKAVTLGKKAFKTFAKSIQENGIGQSELKLTHDAQTILSDYGKYTLSFNPIVALNTNAAKPHATPTSQKLKVGDVLLVDAGLKYERYCSDRTRTVEVQDGFRFQTKNHFSKKRQQKVYDTVLKAHDKAIQKARSGMKASKIDALAREVIEKAGFGEYFVHSTGHGVGLDIHEMPVISSRSKTKVEDGMVFTIEPGIYIPDAFGVRIEDMVVMEEGRAKVL